MPVSLADKFSSDLWLSHALLGGVLAVITLCELPKNPERRPVSLGDGWRVGALVLGGLLGWSMTRFGFSVSFLGGYLLASAITLGASRWSSAPDLARRGIGFFKALPPIPLLLAAALGFAAAVLGGQTVSKRNFTHAFTRFHGALNPQSLYCPPISQAVRYLEKRPDDKILVLLGGASVFHGLGQGPGEEWHRELQRLLGNRYEVVNHALAGAAVPEFAGVTYTILEPKRPKILFVAGCSPGAWREDGKGPYGYFAWDALEQGWLDKDHPRARSLAAIRRQQWRQGKWEEHLSPMLNHPLRFRECWHYVTYQIGSSVWSGVTAGQMWRSRRRVPESGFPISPIGRSGHAARDASILDRFVAQTRSVVVSAPGANQGWIMDPNLEAAYRRQLDALFTLPQRSKILLCLTHCNPRFIRRMTQEEQAINRAAFEASTALFNSEGILTIQAGTAYEDGDFINAAHLTPEGGRKMATEIAPYVRELARRHGFLTPP
jgi:hypothetical protein